MRKTVKHVTNGKVAAKRNHQLSKSVALVALLFSLLSSSIQPSDASTKTSIESEVESIQKKYSAENEAWIRKIRASKTKAEESKLLLLSPTMTKYVPRMTTLMKSAPKDPGAGAAALWLVTAAENPAQAHDAIGILQKYHLRSKTMDDAITFLWFTRIPEVKDLLKAYIAQQPNKTLKTTATFSLAKMFAEENATAEAIKLFEEVARNGKDIPERKNSVRTLEEAANSHLFELRNLLVGKKAPDIQGMDVFGKQFKLSDFAGKVIMLDFFGFW